MTLNFPNIYMLLPNQYDLLKTPAIIFTLLVIGIFALVVWYTHENLNHEEIISYSLWLVMIITFLLPSMHDRYMFIADILSIIYVMVYKKNWYVAIIINLASFSTYSHYLFGESSGNVKFMSYLFTLTILIFTIDLFKSIFLTSQKQNSLS